MIGSAVVCTFAMMRTHLPSSNGRIALRNVRSDLLSPVRRERIEERVFSPSGRGWVRAGVGSALGCSSSFDARALILTFSRREKGRSADSFAGAKAPLPCPLPEYRARE